MKKFISIILFIALGSGAIGQQKIQGTIENYKNGKIYVAEYYGDYKSVIDSCSSDQKGNFEINFPIDTPEGLYRLLFGSNKTLDIIFSNKAFSFKTQFYDPQQRISFEDSQENEALYKYMQAKKEMLFKEQFLLPIISYYPPGNFIAESQKEYEDIHQHFNQVTDDILKQIPNTFAAAYIASDMPARINYAASLEEQRAAVKEMFLSTIDFENAELLHSPLFSQKTIAYLDLFTDDMENRQEQSKLFQPAIDHLLQKSQANKEVYAFIYQYLISGFEENSFPELVSYISQKFPLPKSLSKEHLAEIDALQKLAPGMFAPEIKQEDINGIAFDLEKVRSKYTLLVFWEPNCSSCEKYLPLIRDEILNQYSSKNVTIVGIALSDDPEEARSEIVYNKYFWTNLITPNDWDSPLVKSYVVNATPKFFLLDKKKRIISQPQSLKEILIYLNE